MPYSKLHSVSIVATVLALLALAGPGRAQAPNGWIQDSAWLLLGPLESAAGCDPGTGASSNWIAPLEIGAITPEAGDPAAIDFGAAASTSWGGVGDTPVWLSLEEQGFGGSDIVDARAIADGLAANSGEVIPNENVLAVLVTYVTYSGPAPIVLELCDASDDSVQIWVNNAAVRTVNACRGTAPDCAEITSVVFVPGKNAIKVLLWQGTQGWSFRLRLNYFGGRAITDADPDFAFGYDAAGAVSLSSGFVSRSVTAADFPACATVGDSTVRLSGNGAAGPAVTIVETIAGPVEPFNISDGGVFTPATLPTNKNPVGIFEDARAVGGACVDGETVTNGPGSYTVTGSGTDIWTQGDEFEFAYREATGDFTFTARVSEKTWAPGSRWGKVGIMARQDLSRRSRYSMTQTHGEDARDPDRLAGRRSHGGDDNFELTPFAAEGGEHREWMRLSRAGSIFTGEVSTDGASWEYLGEHDWGASAPVTVLLGLGVCAHSQAQGGCLTATITFDDVELIGGNDPKPPVSPPAGGTITWTNLTRAAINAGISYQLRGDGLVRFAGYESEHSVLGDQQATVASSAVAPGIFDLANDVGQPCVPGQTTFDAGDGSYSITCGGIDIWQNGDQFQYAYKKVTGDFSLVAHVRERTWAPGSRWGKVGIMARQDCTTRSRYAMMQTHGEDPQDYDRFAGRPTHGGADNFEQSNLSGNQHRDWMRLDRIGNSFIGYFSQDGVAWQVAANMNWGPGAPQTVLLGLAVNAHSDTQGGCVPATIVFDQVSFSVPNFSVTRSLGDAGSCPTESESARVVLKGAGDPGPNVAIVETVLGDFTISDITNLGRARVIEEPTGLRPLGLWEDTRDIGEPCTPGSTTQDAPDTYTVTGSGIDIWTNGDQFEYAYRRATGDFNLVAHVQERVWAPGSRWGKVGIMARENHGATSRFAMIQTHGENPVDSDRFAGRRTSGFADLFEQTPFVPEGGTHHDWLRLERVSNIFNGYVSVDGIDWQLVGSMNWGPDSPQTVLLGLAVCAHGDGCQTASITFDELELTGGAGPHLPLTIQGHTITWAAGRPGLTGAGVSYRVAGRGIARVTGIFDSVPIEGPNTLTLTSLKTSALGELSRAHDIGNPCAPGDSVYSADDQSYTVTGGGNDIWQGGDQFQFAYTQRAGDFSMVAHVRERTWAPGSRWGKVGIMAREDCSDRARYAMIQTHGEDPQDADRFAGRPTGGGNDNFESTTLPAAEHRDWMRLDRVGNLFTAYMSTGDGVWDQIGSMDWGDGAPAEVLLGLAVCAHSIQESGCEPATIVFDKVRITDTFVEDGPSFHRGDADDNGQLQLTDAIRILGFLFLGQAAPTCMDAADADDNGSLQLTDAVRILGFLFLGQTPPATPGPPPEPCGLDPTPEDGATDIGCESYLSC